MNVLKYKKAIQIFFAILFFGTVGMTKVFAVNSENPYSNSYFTIESLADSNNVSLNIPNGFNPVMLSQVSYSTDGTEWTTIFIDGTGQSVSVTLDKGDKVYLKGLGRQFYADNRYCYITATASFIVYGNIMSLLYDDDFVSQTEFPAASERTFYGLFIHNPHIVSAEHLVMPAIVLTYSCYNAMFADCLSLTTAPALPATTLADACYEYMFKDCISLIATPILPATTLANGCYKYMFNHCTSLTVAHDLPATTLAHSCYTAMFGLCTSLTNAPALPATTLAENCYGYMFYDCTSLSKVPDLPAPILAKGCYHEMFIGCLLIDEITCLATDISANNCTLNWLAEVAPIGTFHKSPEMEDWPLNDVSGIPEGWGVDNWDAVNEQQDQIAIYPNPVERGDNLHIGTDANGIGGIRVEILDVFGKLIGIESSTLIAAPKDTGVYTLRITMKRGTCCRKLVVR